MAVPSSWFKNPRLVKKIKHFHDHLKKNDGKIGTYHRGIELNYNNACNLRCKYCFTNSPQGDHVKDFLPISKIKEKGYYNSAEKELLNKLRSQYVETKTK